MREQDALTDHALPFEYIKTLAERDAKGDTTDEQSDLLRAGAYLDTWRRALIEIKSETTVRIRAIKADMLKRRQECLRAGYPGKAQWLNYQAHQEARKERELAFLGAIERHIIEANMLVKEAHRQQSLRAAAEYVALRRAGYDLDPAVLRIVQCLTEAIVPLASLDYLLTSEAKADTHLAAYKAVRLKVADIRAARAAWLEAQSLLGSGVVAKNSNTGT